MSSRKNPKMYIPILSTGAFILSLCLFGPCWAINYNPHAAQNPVQAVEHMPVSKLGEAYEVHNHNRNAIAARLDSLWSRENEIIHLRDRKGRAGDMVSVIELNQELVSVRKQIDYLRSGLSLENKLILRISDRMDHNL
jgi:hypothetical protein